MPLGPNGSNLMAGLTFFDGCWPPLKIECLGPIRFPLGLPRTPVWIVPWKGFKSEFPKIF